MGEEYGIYLLIFLTYIFTIYPQNIHKNKILNPWNTHNKKSWAYEIPTRRNFVPTKYPWEKNLDPQDTQKKKTSNPQDTQKKRIWTHKIDLLLSFFYFYDSLHFNSPWMIDFFLFVLSLRPNAQSSAATEFVNFIQGHVCIAEVKM